jgi:predicted secreted protein
MPKDATIMRFSCLNFKWPGRTLFWVAVSLTTFYASILYAGQVTFAWDANSPEPDGYHIFKRVENQSYDYSSPVWSGTATTCSIDELKANTYYFVARAYAGMAQSGDSNEVEFKVVVNQPPQADAGADQAVSANTRVTLDGSGSSDPDGTIATYQWTQTDGPSVALANASSAQSAFDAPNVTGSTTLSFNLAVTDPEGLSANDACQITVVPSTPATPQDSDNDGISDVDETELYGTDPNNPDSDGDGVPDGEELSTGTDPTTPNDHIVYENAEDGTIDGWTIYDKTPAGASIFNIYDEDRQSSVIELVGTGTKNGFRLRNDDGGNWQNTNTFFIQWSMKYSEPFKLYIDVETTEGHRYVQYEPVDGDVLGDGEYVKYGLGSDAANGKWQTFARDLQADLENGQPGVQIIEVNGFLIRGSGKVDDIKLLDTMPIATLNNDRVYENAEDGTIDGWFIYDKTPAGASIFNVYDEDRQSSVIELVGTGTKNGFRLRNDDGGDWQNNNAFFIQWSMKYSEPFKLYIDVETTEGHRYVQYEPVDGDVLGDGEYVKYGLGSDAANGKWKTFARDLYADLQNAQSGIQIVEVNGFLIRGSGKIDDIKLLH